MPKHDRRERSRSEERSRNVKKHKHSKEIPERDTTSRKPKQYASDSANSSPEAYRTKHRSQDGREATSRRPESPPRKRHRDIKHEYDDDRDNRRTRNIRDNHRRSDSNIKKEEDFDRRQDELRRRRAERSSRHEHGHRSENVRIKQEQDDDHRQHPSHSNRGDDEERRRNDDRRREDHGRRERNGEVEDAFKKDDTKPPEKEKPNLGLSGALTEDTNTFRGVVIKYNEPLEARIPKKRWRLYPFKGTETLKTLHLHRQSAYLLGRQRRIADIPIDHPSCSKQHAVIQFRMVECEVDGVLRRRVKPYVIDLAAANGTYVNNERIEAQRYVELKEQDILKFGFSSREYVLLHDKSDTTDIQSGSEEEEEED